MVIQDYMTGSAFDFLNIYHEGGNVLVGKTGNILVPVVINNATGQRTVKLLLYGRKCGANANKTNHGVGRHNHGYLEIRKNNNTDGLSTISTAGNWGALNTANNFARFTGGDSDGSTGYVGDSAAPTTVPTAAVPKYVKIYIDGVDKTSAIGDQNSKGATMYDSVGSRWGVDGTTEWTTGVLDLTSVISWTAGVHEIEIRETGDVGGTLVYHVGVNTGM